MTRVVARVAARVAARVRRLAVVTLAAAASCAFLPDSLSAQEVRSVSGRVVRSDTARGDSTGMAAVAGVWVTLHRVGKDAAGPVDSVRTDARGAYRLRWTTSGAPDAVYFASVSWDGIAYFTPPLRDATNQGEATEISVFDTTSRVFPLTVRGRHLIVSAADSTDTRTVIEVFELSNDSSRALVSRDGSEAAPTWSIAVPEAARDPRANEGAISPDAFAFAPGRVSVFAPIAPGLKQISFSYNVPASAFPMRFTAADGAVVFEVLLEEPQGRVASEGFTAADPVSIEGRAFRRFLAQDVKPGTEVLVELPASRTPTRNLYIAGLLAGIGFLMLLVLSRAMRRRASAPRSASSGPQPVVSSSWIPGVASMHLRLVGESQRQTWGRWRAIRPTAIGYRLSAIGKPAIS